jgi:hypothetical protein|nr:MAG TPA: hypothetical protein [Caudoviricetes sp.]
MEMLTLIVALSAVLWYVIDRAHPLWENLSYGKWITLVVAGIGSFGLVFSFGLDLIFACGLVDSVSMAGQILTGFVLMSGSSAISEVIARIKGEGK